MFTNRIAHRNSPPARPKGERGLATLRVYVPAPAPMIGAIFEEAVIGAYKQRGGADITLVTRGGPEGELHLYRTFPKAGCIRHLGVFDGKLREGFDKAQVGEMFFLRDAAMIKLDKPDISAAVYRSPVWFALSPDQEEAPQAAPAIPFGARLNHRSMFAPPEPPKRPEPPPRCRGFCPDMFDEDLEKESPSM